MVQEPSSHGDSLGRAGGYGGDELEDDNVGIPRMVSEERQREAAARTAEAAALASKVSIGMVVEKRAADGSPWIEGFVTSLQPLAVTLVLKDGPSAQGMVWPQVRLLSAERQREVDTLLAARQEVVEKASVGAVVEYRAGGGGPWITGYLTSLDPLLVTPLAAGGQGPLWSGDWPGPSGLGTAWDEVRSEHLFRLEPGTYCCVERAGATLDAAASSEIVHVHEAGDELDIAETRRMPDGRWRVRGPEGWVSFVSERGTQLLQLKRGVPAEHETPGTAAFDLPISHMLGDTKVVANIRTSDTVSTVKQKLAAQLPGTEPDALKVLLTVKAVKGDLAQVDLEIETRTLEEYGVGRGSELMWQAQDPANAKARQEERKVAAEAERVRVAEAEREAAVCKAKCWLVPLLCSVVVPQVGWWSLYSDLGLWCAIIGGVLMLVGGTGFNIGTPGHSEYWHDVSDNVLQPTFNVGQLIYGFFLLFLTGFFTGFSASCPARGTVPANGDPMDDEWVLPEAASANATAGGREYGWGDRWDTGGPCSCECRGTAIGAGILLPLTLYWLQLVVLEELSCMRAKGLYVRRKSDGRMGVATNRYSTGQIRVEWDVPRSENSERGHVDDFEMLSFEAHACLAAALASTTRLRAAQTDTGSLPYIT
jgi:hypothetical protein